MYKAICVSASVSVSLFVCRQTSVCLLVCLCVVCERSSGAILVNPNGGILTNRVPNVGILTNRVPNGEILTNRVPNR